MERFTFIDQAPNSLQQTDSLKHGVASTLSTHIHVRFKDDCHCKTVRLFPPFGGMGVYFFFFFCPLRLPF